MKTSYLLALFALGPLCVCWGTNFIIFNGQTETSTRVLENIGNSGIIAPGGAINTTNENGVNMENDEQSLENEGTLSTTGDNANAVFNDGGNNSSINSGGEISTTGNNAHGIQSTSGNGVLITNNGSIETQGENSHAIFTTGNDNIVANSGMITTNEEGAIGILTSFSEGAQILNTGTISTMEENGFALSLQNSLNSTMTNSGLIQTIERTANGMHNLSGGGNTLINHGTIQTEGELAHGIFNNVSNNALVENSGTIQTTGQQAFGIFSIVSDNCSFINKGTIQTEGQASHGIFNNFTVDVLITNSGTIQTIGQEGSGINNISGQNSTILNSGTIQTTGLQSFGISNSQSSNTFITNSGTIYTTGTLALGIFNLESINSTILNKGTILTEGEQGVAIANAEADNAFIENSGTIQTEGLDSQGIYIFLSSNTEISQSGLIYTLGESSHGILNEGSNDLFLTNKGTIRTNGMEAHAIFNDTSDNVSIFNKGYLLAEGEDSDALFSSGTNLSITNSGTIESIQGFALNLFGLNPTLTSLPCSKIIGPVSSEEPLNIIVPTPFNMVLTLSEDSAGFGTLSINAPFVRSGNTIAILDPRAFAPHSDIVADLSDTLLNSLSPPCSTLCTLDRSSFWVEAIGSTRERGSGYERYRFRQGGFLAGYTSHCLEGAPLSLFGGAVYGKIRPSESGCNLDLDPETKSYVAGISLRSPVCNGCFFLSLIGGTLEIDQNRTIFDNLAEGGVIKVEGSRSGLFLTPEASIKQLFCLLNRPLSITATLRYAGFFPGSYSEPLSKGGLHLESKWMSLLTGRFLLGLPYQYVTSKNCLNIEPYIGGSTRLQLSSKNTRGRLLEQPLIFSSNLCRNIGSLIYGLKASVSATQQEFYLAFEGNEEPEDSRRFIGSVGFSFGF